MFQFASLKLLCVDTGAVLEDTLARFKTEVEPVIQRVALLQMVHHAQALQVVLKPAMRRHAFVERILPGVAKRGVAEVVCQRYRLHQIFIQSERAGGRAAQLGHFQRVREARAKQVALVVEEHLRFVHQPAKSGGMDNAITVALELGAGRCGQFMKPPPTRLCRVASRHTMLKNHKNSFCPRPI